MNLVELLREQAAEIAAEGHFGWGNTMLEAAREIESLQQQAAQQSVQSDADWSCSNCGYVNKGEWQECRHCQTPRR